MGTIEFSQPASKSSWDSQDFGGISMVLKMAHFRKSTGPRWFNKKYGWSQDGRFFIWTCIISQIMIIIGVLMSFEKPPTSHLNKYVTDANQHKIVSS